MTPTIVSTNKPPPRHPAPPRPRGRAALAAAALVLVAGAARAQHRPQHLALELKEDRGMPKFEVNRPIAQPDPVIKVDVTPDAPLPLGLMK